jgi:predicted dehydrogenase
MIPHHSLDDPRWLDRRTFLAGAAALSLTAAASSVRGSQPARKYRVAVIGHTGRGDYGHGLDEVWRDVPQTEVVAVADSNAQGLAEELKKLDITTGYSDYRQMLDEMKPDLVAVAPRFLDEHRDMVVAAAERGVRGIYLEKPLCRTLAEADEMIAACELHGVKLAIAFQTRYSQKLPVIEKLIDTGRIGQVIEYRARGKEDRLRGGSEDLWILGTHMFNLIHHFGGEPQSCSASVYQGGQPLSKEHVAEGNEGIGPLAGDDIHARYRLASGATAYFDSVRNAAGSPSRFGLEIFGTQGIIQMVETGHLPECYFLRDSCWSPWRSEKNKNEWIPISSAGPGKPEPLTDQGLHGGNVLAVHDLIAAIEEDRQPLTSIYAARTSLEMIVAVFESQRLGRTVPLPLENRQNPLTMLGEPKQERS